MGIKGLLPLLKKALKRTHISKYANSRVGIDGHAWIHRVIPYIAPDLYYNRPTEKHIDLFMAKLRGLADYGITPVLVFDGDFLESKRKTVDERKRIREKCRAEAEFYLARNDVTRAHDLMKRCVSVTPEILHSILRVLRSNNIEYIVSPYEADAQLYFLQQQKYIDYIVTEDSDLVVYGATKLLLKFDGAHADEYDSARLPLCRDKHFQDNILDICILSGCDYLDSIKGVGLITAHEKLKAAGSVSSFISSMSSMGKFVPHDYPAEFEKAKATFLHHIVYNPLSGQREFLTEPSKTYDFLGSLEDTPLVVRTALSARVELHRHYVPKCQPVSETFDDNDSCSFERCEEFILDSNLALPYFQ